MDGHVGGITSIKEVGLIQIVNTHLKHKTRIQNVYKKKRNGKLWYMQT